MENASFNTPKPVWYSRYAEENGLSPEDQKFIWELLSPNLEENRLTNNSVYVNGSVNGTYKRQGNLEQNLTKQQAITKLRDCNYRTPPKELASYLETIFGIWKEKPLHWLFIAVYYTPKAINSAINEMQKRKERGNMPLNEPGAYFTKILTRYHAPRRTPKRKIFRDTSGSRKQQVLERDLNDN